MSALHLSEGSFTRPFALAQGRSLTLLSGSTAVLLRRGAHRGIEIAHDLRRLEAAPPRVRLGRNSLNEFQVGDPAWSRFHLAIEIDEDSDEIVLRDLLSANGTALEDSRLGVRIEIRRPQGPSDFLPPEIYASPESVRLTGFDLAESRSRASGRDRVPLDLDDPEGSLERLALRIEALGDREPLPHHLRSFEFLGEYLRILLGKVRTESSPYHFRRPAARPAFWALHLYTLEAERIGRPRGRSISSAPTGLPAFLTVAVDGRCVLAAPPESDDYVACWRISLDGRHDLLVRTVEGKPASLAVERREGNERRERRLGGEAVYMGRRIDLRDARSVRIEYEGRSGRLVLRIDDRTLELRLEEGHRTLRVEHRGV